jgi:hypothetical protein
MKWTCGPPKHLTSWLCIRVKKDIDNVRSKEDTQFIPPLHQKGTRYDDKMRQTRNFLLAGKVGMVVYKMGYSIVRDGV